MNKSNVLALAACVSAALTIAAPLPAPAADKIVISNWDGYMPEDLLSNFEKATGIKAEHAVHATNEEIMGKVVASGGRGYDVLFVSSPFAEALQQLQLAAPIDHSLIPNLRNLYAEAGQLGYDPGNTFSVPYAWGTTGLCYRADLVAGAPGSWDDLLSPQADLRGKVTMLSTDRWLMAAGLLSLGYSVNEKDDARINEAGDLLIEAKRHLLSYDDTTFYSKLVSGEAALTHAWDGWCNYGIAENADIKYVIPREGTDLWVDTMVIVADSENREAAHRFIDYVLNAEVGAWVASNILYKVPNRAAMEALDPALFTQFPNLAMKPADLLRQEQLRDLGETQKAYTRMVTKILSSR